MRQFDSSALEELFDRRTAAIDELDAVDRALACELEPLVAQFFFAYSLQPEQFVSLFWRSAITDIRKANSDLDPRITDHDLEVAIREMARRDELIASNDGRSYSINQHHPLYAELLAAHLRSFG